MTLEEKTYKAMQEGCISYVQQNQTLWTSIARIKKNVESLVANGKELELAVQAQADNDPGGLVDKKNELMKRLSLDFFPFSCKLSFYAKDEMDMVLLKDVDLSKSDFRNSSMIDFFTTCSTLLKRGREYLTISADCGVTEEEMTSLEKKLTDTMKLPVAVEIMNNEHKLATRSIKAINAEARVTFEKLDDAFNGYFADKKEFLTGWFQIRKIKGRPVRKKKKKKDIIKGDK